MDGLNLLTWFLYLADVLQNFAGFLGFLAFAIPCFIVVFMFIQAIVTESMKLIGERTMALPLKRLTALWLAACLFGAAIPSKDTMYLMAASEIGEEALESEIADQIKEYISRMLDNPDAAE